MPSALVMMMLLLCSFQMTLAAKKLLGGNECTHKCALGCVRGLCGNVLLFQKNITKIAIAHKSSCSRQPNQMITSSSKRISKGQLGNVRRNIRS